MSISRLLKAPALTWIFALSQTSLPRPCAARERRYRKDGNRMGHRESVLTEHGYEVTYKTSPKYRGSTPTRHCIAIKDGVRYFAFTIDHRELPDHYKRIV